MSTYLAEFIFKHNRSLAFLALMLTIGGGVLGLRVEPGFSADNLYTNDPEDRARHTQYLEDFGDPATKTVVLLLERKEGWFNFRAINEIQTRLARLKAIESLSGVLGLTSLRSPVYDPKYGFRLQPLFQDDFEIDDALVASLKETHGKSDSKLRAWVSEDGRDLRVILQTQEPLTPVSLATLQSETSKVLEGVCDKIHWIGVPIIDSYMIQVLKKELPFLVGMTGLVIFLLLWMFLGSWIYALISMLGVGSAVAIIRGSMVLFGFKMTHLNNVVLSLVLMIGVAESIHFLGAYSKQQMGQHRDMAVRSTLAEMLLPAFLTTLTTVIAFASLGLAKLDIVRNFGLLCALGVASAFVFNMIWMPLALKTVTSKEVRPLGFLNRFLSHYENRVQELVLQKPGRIVVVGGILLVGVCASLPWLDTNQKALEELMPSDPVRQSQERMLSKFSGVFGPDLVVKLRKPLEKFDEVERQKLSSYLISIGDLESDPSQNLYRNTISIFDFLPAKMPLSELDRALRMLRTDPLMASSINAMINSEHNTIVLRLRGEDHGCEPGLAVLDGIRKGLLNQNTLIQEVDFVGHWFLMNKGKSQLVSTLVSSFVLAAFLVLPIAFMLVRQRRRWLWIALINLCPMLVGLGVMVALGSSLRIGTAMILAIALGIAVDDTIHFLTGLRRHEDSETTIERSLAQSMRVHGRPIFMTTCILIGGFMVLRLSPLVASQDMGLIGALSLSSAYLADVLLLPAIVLIQERRRSFKNNV